MLIIYYINFIITILFSFIIIILFFKDKYLKNFIRLVTIKQSNQAEFLKLLINIIYYSDDSHIIFQMSYKNFFEHYQPKNSFYFD